MTPTRWIVFALVAVIGLGGLVALSKKDAIDVSNVDQTKVVSNDTFTDHVYGKKDSRVVLVEYGDFQCPACGSVFPQINEIKEAYKDKVAFVFRQFPLTSIHPNALAAAGVAEAADRQGKFWEMHDLLFQTQKSWEQLGPSERGPVFESYARQLRLDINKFNEDLASKAVSERISYARALGGKAKVSATPTLFLDGVQLSDDIRNDLSQKNGEMLRQKLDDALKSVGETPPAKTAR